MFSVNIRLKLFCCRVIINVLRQGSKACVVKRKFSQARILITQALTLADEKYAYSRNALHADILMDKGFFLLNFDSIQESVHAYVMGLETHKNIFEKNNIHVAVGMEDLAYAHYVNEYSSGDFYSARYITKILMNLSTIFIILTIFINILFKNLFSFRENAERAIRIMEKILPKDHLLLASAKRVKALILEEIALDMRGDISNQSLQQKFLTDSELLHIEALELSRKSFGENNVQTAKHYGNLGRLYQSMQLYDRAEKMHLKAIAIKQQLLGPDDYEVGLSLGHLASLYNYHMKKYKKAEVLYLKSIAISFAAFGDLYSGLEYDYRGLINVYSELQDINKLVHYSQVMRDWKMRRRNLQRPKTLASLKPLQEVIDTFLKLC